MTAKWGVAPSWKDVLWATQNEKVMEAASKGNWQEAGRRYFLMSLDLFETGKPHLSFTRIYDPPITTVFDPPRGRVSCTILRS